MTERFADTNYLVALAFPRDQYAPLARRYQQDPVMTLLVTSEFVLAEFLGFVCEAGPHTRRQAVNSVRELRAAATAEVVDASPTLFERALRLYEARPDKGYSLVDCTSMVIMRERGIEAVLSGDRHFDQEGFQALLRI